MVYGLHPLKVWDNNGSSLVLAANNEEEMAKWMQALCMAVIGDKVSIATYSCQLVNIIYRPHPLCLQYTRVVLFVLSC